MVETTPTPHQLVHSKIAVIDALTAVL